MSVMTKLVTTRGAALFLLVLWASIADAQLEDRALVGALANKMPAGWQQVGEVGVEKLQGTVVRQRVLTGFRSPSTPSGSFQAITVMTQDDLEASGDTIRREASEATCGKIIARVGKPLSARGWWDARREAYFCEGRAQHSTTGSLDVVMAMFATTGRLLVLNGVGSGTTKLERHALVEVVRSFVDGARDATSQTAPDPQKASREIDAQIARKMRQGMKKVEAARYVLNGFIGYGRMLRDAKKTGPEVRETRALIQAAEEAYMAECRRCASAEACNEDRLGLLVEQRGISSNPGPCAQ